MRYATQEYREFVEGLADRCIAQHKPCVYNLTLTVADVKDALKVLGTDIEEFFTINVLTDVLGRLRLEAGSVVIDRFELSLIGSRLIGTVEGLISTFVADDVDGIIARIKAERREEAGDLRSDEQRAADEAAVPLAGPL